MNKYRNLTNEELLSLWETKRGEVGNAPTQADIDELLEMRREIDRRQGKKPPQIFVNFEEQYLTK